MYNTVKLVLVHLTLTLTQANSAQKKENTPPPVYISGIVIKHI